VARALSGQPLDAWSHPLWSATDVMEQRSARTGRRGSSITPQVHHPRCTSPGATGAAVPRPRARSRQSSAFGPAAPPSGRRWPLATAFRQPLANRHSRGWHLHLG
jgi:hypothetical protein